MDRGLHWDRRQSRGRGGGADGYGAIQIKMHYSSNLVVDAAVEPSSLAVETGSPFTVSAVLRSGGTTATSSSDYASVSLSLESTV